MATKPSAPDPAVIERIGELLRAHGLRRMASRIAVLAVLEPVNGHLSVAEIDQRLREFLPADDQHPDLATIYRTVTTLVDQGVLHALTLEGGTTTYGPAADPHHHAVCTRCGSIIE
ncbi:MAG: Fur family transcriptional regulator, partial [Mycobacterium sp.]